RVRRIEIRWGDPEHINGAFQADFANVRELVIDPNIRIAASTIDALETAPWYGKLATLDLGRVAYFRDRAPTLLADAGPLVELRGMPEAARLLAATPHQLETLDLSDSEVGPELVTELAGAPHLQRLRALNLAGNELHPPGAATIADTFPELRVLDLTNT